MGKLEIIGPITPTAIKSSQNPTFWVVICLSFKTTDLEDFFCYPYPKVFLYFLIVYTPNTNGWILKTAQGWWTVTHLEIETYYVGYQNLQRKTNSQCRVWPPGTRTIKVETLWRLSCLAVNVVDYWGGTLCVVIVASSEDSCVQRWILLTSERWLMSLWSSLEVHEDCCVLLWTVLNWNWTCVYFRLFCAL